jgi:hypothetical protein
MANPNANAIPSTLMAVGPVPIPAMTTAPHPKKTSANVPMNSAVGFFIFLPSLGVIDYFTTLQQLGFLRTGDKGINTPLMLTWSNVPSWVNRYRVEPAAAQDVVQVSKLGFESCAEDAV